MTRFIEGLGRDQVKMLPECLDDYVEEANPVRVVDAFIEMSYSPNRQTSADVFTTIHRHRGR